VPLGYYRGTLAADQVIAESGPPYTVLRTAQFHDLIRTMFAGAAKLPVMPVPAIRAQPVDVRDVAARLADLTLGEPQGRASDLGGPEVRDLPGLAREYLTATDRRHPLLPVRVPGRAFPAYRDGGNLAREHADATITFAANLMFTVPHFLFHTTHLKHFPTGSAVGQTVTLAFGVLIPATLLALSMAGPEQKITASGTDNPHKSRTVASPMSGPEGRSSCNGPNPPSQRRADEHPLIIRSPSIACRAVICQQSHGNAP
jgi:hypothetical protein